MPFTKSNIQTMAKAMKQAAGALLAPIQVDLYGGGTARVKIHVGQRRASSPEITAGALSENQYATIDAEDWDAVVDRPPQKGDVIHWAERRFAIETVQMIAPAGQLVFYKARLQG